MTRKASGANNFRRGFFPLLFLTEIKDYPHSRHDSSKRTGSIREGSTPPPLPKEVKRNFVPREKDSSDPNGRCHHPEEERNTLFVRSASSLKEGSFPRRPTTSLPGEENQPRLIRETSTLVTEIKRNSSQREQPLSQGFSPLRGRRARKEFRREFKDLFAVKGFFPIPVILR